MATINSNCLGLYALSSANGSPLEVLDTATSIAALTNADAPSGVAENEMFLVVNSGVFTGVASVSSATGSDSVTDETGNLSLMALATSSSLETSNSITETAARDGNCGSTNYIASGALSWTMNVDGLLDVASGAGSAITVMDAARNKYYLIGKFEIAEGGTATTFYAGQTIIDSVTLTGGVDDIATYSASLSGYGDLYKGTTA